MRVNLAPSAFPPTAVSNTAPKKTAAASGVMTYSIWPPAIFCQAKTEYRHPCGEWRHPVQPIEVLSCILWQIRKQDAEVEPFEAQVRRGFEIAELRRPGHVFDCAEHGWEKYTHGGNRPPSPPPTSEGEWGEHQWRNQVEMLFDAKRPADEKIRYLPFVILQKEQIGRIEGFAARETDCDGTRQ